MYKEAEYLKMMYIRRLNFILLKKNVIKYNTELRRLFFTGLRDFPFFSFSWVKRLLGHSVLHSCWLGQVKSLSSYNILT